MNPAASTPIGVTPRPPVTALALKASTPATVQPLTPERYKLQFTISRETHDRLRRVQALARATIPSGDPAEIFDRALTLLLGGGLSPLFARRVCGSAP